MPAKRSALEPIGRIQSRAYDEQLLRGGPALEPRLSAPDPRPVGGGDESNTVHERDWGVMTPP